MPKPSSMCHATPIERGMGIVVVKVTLESLLWNVEGRALGKSQRYTGSRNSMNGTTTKTEKGTTRKMSPTVLRNYIYMYVYT